MAVRFILDPELKHKQQTVAEILQLTTKHPYPTKDATHLASFVEACFYAAEEERLKAEARRKEAEKQREWEEEERRRKADAEEKQRRLEMEAPVPEAPLLGLEEAPGAPSLEELTPLEGLPPLEAPAPAAPQQLTQKREYVLRIYDAPVGVLVDKNDGGEYVYHVVEPQVEDDVVAIALDLYRSSLEKDNSLFDDKVFMAKAATKVASKAGIRMSDMLVPQVRYYLERDILGGGKFDPFLYDERVRAVYCDGVNKPLHVDYADMGNIATNVVVTDADAINRFMKRVAFSTGKVLDDKNPILDVVFHGLKFEGIMGVGGGSSKLTVRRLS